jgi:hypothetical protein
MLVDDDMISEDIDLADSDDGFADVERIELPVRYARHDILIEELARIEHVSPSHKNHPSSRAFSLATCHGPREQLVVVSLGAVPDV